MCQIRARLDRVDRRLYPTLRDLFACIMLSAPLWGWAVWRAIVALVH